MPVRGTQSFLHIQRECWRRPSLLALEVLWRWAFGIPFAALLAWQAWRIYTANAAPLAGINFTALSIADPMNSAVALSNVYAIFAPSVMHALSWVVPVGLVGWAVASGIGRSAVLRRYDPSLPRRWGSLILLQLLRVVFFTASIIFWFAAIRWSASVTLWSASQNIIGYFALVICISLVVFTLWALVSWVFSIAPLLLLLERCGIASSLARSFRLGPLTAKLIEINFIMGILKLALMVLAMIWSAMPLPFEAQVQGNSLYAWWAVGTILYCIASDFFQVARLAAYVEFWRTFSVHSPAVPTPSASAVAN
ncbi:MAG TPA: hypothetical protein VGT04_04680 [Acidobacteriaceae bacterium]|nr:hypothetical protein [Acidobacteriaceae bacterium]